MSRHLLILHGILLATLVGVDRPDDQPNPRPARNPPPQHWSLSLSAGPSFPIGDFASKEFANYKSGHANTGAVAELSLTYWLNRYIGGTFTAAGQTNSVGSYNTPANPFTGGATINSDSWKIARFLLGPQFNLPLSTNGLSLELRAQAGVLKTSIPGFSYSESNGGGKLPAVPFSWTFAYEGAAGLRWQLPGRVFLFFDAAYTGANAAYSKTETQTVNGLVVGITYTHYEKTFSSIQTTLGAGINF